MNKTQAEGRVNNVCTVERRRRSSTLLLKNNETQLLASLKSFLLISMVELDHQRSAAMLIKWDLIYLCCLTYLIIAGLHHILSLRFIV